MSLRMDPAIYVLEDRLEQLRQETTIIELAISSLLALSVDDAPIASTDQGAGSIRPSAVEPAPEINQCDECDRSFETAHGLLVHQRRSHKEEVVGNVAVFDPDAARAAAAAAS